MVIEALKQKEKESRTKIKMIKDSVIDEACEIVSDILEVVSDIIEEIIDSFF